MGDKRIDFGILDFNTYEDYLESYTTKQDKQYLRRKDVIAKYLKLGYRATSAPYDAAEFKRRQFLAMNAIRPKTSDEQYFSRYLSPNNKDPVLLQFKEREFPIYSKILATIVFTMYTDNKGSEISAYIDLGMSWANTTRQAYNHANWKGIYEGRAHLRPMPHHLSYRNAQYNVFYHTDSDNFKVVHDDRYGLMFMHKGDHKYLPVGGHDNPFNRNVNRSTVISPKYGSVIFYDHALRKKV
ncbi:cilia- and flagella-associated protein 299 [Drosophila navojoa]|uniref:cilia- and flagella-associated protein 299 n=1 Tax=Drosophila navojoa TaxID=7232 RepID=UPI0011BE14DE|nr:cilia- and flagella-associated protein 299 [Drosophila navojoa]